MRFFGLNLSDTTPVLKALTGIYGIGLPQASKLCLELGINSLCPIRLLAQKQIDGLRKLIESNLLIEGELRKKLQYDINALVSSHCNRGNRLKSGLPVRGQRTRTNAKTSRKFKRYASKQ